jgi:hypothetical protein
MSQQCSDGNTSRSNRKRVSNLRKRYPVGKGPVASVSCSGNDLGDHVKVFPGLPERTTRQE